MASGNSYMLHRLPVAFAQDNLAVQCCGKKYIYGYKNTIYQELYFAIPLVIHIRKHPVVIDFSWQANDWINVFFSL